MARGNEFYGPVQQALGNLNNQVNISFERRRRQEQEINDSAMKRLTLEHKMSDPTRRLRIEQAAHSLAPATMKVPEFEGSKVRQDNVAREQVRMLKTMLPESVGDIRIENGQIMNSQGVVRVPRWMAKRADLAMRSSMLHYNDPRVIREDKIRRLSHEVKHADDDGFDMQLKEGGRKKALQAQLDKEKSFDMMGPERLVEIQNQEKNLNRILALNTQDPVYNEHIKYWLSGYQKEAAAIHASKGNKNYKPVMVQHTYEARDNATNKPIPGRTAIQPLDNRVAPQSRLDSIVQGGALGKDQHWALITKGATGGKGSGTKGMTELQAVNLARGIHKDRLTNATKILAITEVLKDSENLGKWINSDELDDMTKSMLTGNLEQQLKYLDELKIDLQGLQDLADSVRDPEAREKLDTLIKSRRDPKNLEDEGLIRNKK
jgi:hypothetical protein